ncbi:hypothetical protein MXE38_03675 [Anaerobiospirillum sp. NML120448]|uniref:hypothetical protein n=1 Tax=Anaerobiospirillum sp. NML120448 TaxID=2932816 RepID=UPI001FF4F8F1|nr:hypothetical protein [Anaerobiospirillum sp. NML120448]MCK0513966.1 hypothetical protein [Anaerobiospirillum sp. NML120448]
MLSNNNLSQEASTLTKWLVSIPSVAHAKGPALICQAIHDGLVEFPYFKKNKDKLHLIEHQDSNKSSVIALVKAMEEVSQTIVLLCDTDTASPYHYGMLKGYSTNCDELLSRLKELDELNDSKVKEGIANDDLLFGLGVLQSKCATGSMLVALKELSDNYVRLNVNVLFICTSESAIQHRGIKKCIPFIQELIDREKLTLRLAINAKPNFPLFRKDQDLHIFTGNYGKVEPSFYIIGNSAASFKPYSGFSASIIASELIRELELNAKLTQKLHNSPLVPTFDSLRVKEFGKEYSPDGMQISFSMPIVNLDLNDLLEILKEAAAKAIENASDLVDQREAMYAHINQEDFTPQVQDAEVVSFSDLLERASHNFTGNLHKALHGMVQKCRSEGLSLHQASITIIERLNELAKLPRPSVVVYFTDNFLPPQGLSASLSQDRELFMILDDLLSRFNKLSPIAPTLATYYAPTDACLLRPIGLQKSLSTLRQECPVGVEDIEGLNVPTITLGVKGDNLTLLTEYVEKSMFEYLPSLVVSIVDAIGENPVGAFLQAHQDLQLQLEQLAEKAESISAAVVNESREISEEQQGEGFYSKLSQGKLEPESLEHFLQQQQAANNGKTAAKLSLKNVKPAALQSPETFAAEHNKTTAPDALVNTASVLHTKSQAHTEEEVSASIDEQLAQQDLVKNADKLQEQENQKVIESHIDRVLDVAHHSQEVEHAQDVDNTQNDTDADNSDLLNAIAQSINDDAKLNSEIATTEPSPILEPSKVEIAGVIKEEQSALGQIKSLFKKDSTTPAPSQATATNAESKAETETDRNSSLENTAPNLESTTEQENKTSVPEQDKEHDSSTVLTDTQDNAQQSQALESDTKAQTETDSNSSLENTATDLESTTEQENAALVPEQDKEQDNSTVLTDTQDNAQQDQALESDTKAQTETDSNSTLENTAPDPESTTEQENEAPVPEQDKEQDSSTVLTDTQDNAQQDQALEKSPETDSTQVSEKNLNADHDQDNIAKELDNIFAEKEPQETPAHSENHLSDINGDINAKTSQSIDHIESHEGDLNNSKVQYIESFEPKIINAKKQPSQDAHELELDKNDKQSTSLPVSEPSKAAASSKDSTSTHEEGKSSPFAIVSSFFKSFKRNKAQEKSDHSAHTTAMKTPLGVEDEVDWLNTPELAQGKQDKSVSDQDKELSIENIKSDITNTQDKDQLQLDLSEHDKNQELNKDIADLKSTDKSQSNDDQNIGVSSEQVADLLLTSIKNKLQTNSLASLDDPKDYQQNDIPLNNNVYATDIALGEVEITKDKLPLETKSSFNTVVSDSPKAERIAAEKAEQERLEAARIEAERIAAEKAEQERLEAERIEAERIAAEKAEQERLEAERLEAERIAAEKAEQERLEAERIEAERIAAEKAEQERLEAERLEAERIAAEKAEQERLEAERIEAERIAAEKAEQERLEAERIAAEKAEQERLEAERLESERIAAEKAEQERLETERLEAERIAAEKAEQERLEAERIEAERIAAEKAEQERLEAERIAAERIDAETAEQERLEAERIAAEKAEQERLEAERIEAERIAAEKAEQERLEAERIAAEKAEQERLEAERIAAEKKAKEERLEAEPKSTAKKSKQKNVSDSSKADNKANSKAAKNKDQSSGAESKKLSRLEELTIRLAAMRAGEDEATLKDKLNKQQEQFEQEKSAKSNASVSLPSNMDLTKAIDSNVTMLSKKAFFISEDPHNTRNPDEVFAEAEAEAAAKRAEAQKRLKTLSEALAKEKEQELAAQKQPAIEQQQEQLDKQLKDADTANKVDSSAKDNKTEGQINKPDLAALNKLIENAKAEAKLAQAETKADTGTATPSEVKADTEVTAKVDTDTDAPAQVKVDAEVAAKVDTGTAAPAEVKSDTEVAAKVDTGTAATAQVNADAEVATEVAAKDSLEGEYHSVGISSENANDVKSDVEAKAEAVIQAEVDASDENIFAEPVLAPGLDEPDFEFNLATDEPLAPQINSYENNLAPSVLEVQAEDVPSIKTKSDIDYDTVTEVEVTEVISPAPVKANVNIQEAKIVSHSNNDRSFEVEPLDEATVKEIASLRKVGTEEAIAELLYANEDFSEEADLKASTNTLEARRAALRRAMYGDDSSGQETKPKANTKRGSYVNLDDYKQPVYVPNQVNHSHEDEANLTPTRVVGSATTFPSEPPKEDSIKQNSYPHNKMEPVASSSAGVRILRTPNSDLRKALRDKRAAPTFSTAIVGKREPVETEAQEAPVHSIGIVGKLESHEKEQQEAPKFSTAIVGKLESHEKEQPQAPTHSIGIVGKLESHEKEQQEAPKFSTAIVGKLESQEKEPEQAPEHSIGIVGKLESHEKEQQEAPKFSTAIVGKLESQEKEPEQAPEHSIGIVGKLESHEKEQQEAPKFSTAIVGKLESHEKEPDQAPAHSIGIVGKLESHEKEQQEAPKFSTAIVGKREPVDTEVKEAPKFSTAIESSRKSSPLPELNSETNSENEEFDPNAPKTVVVRSKS